MADDYWDKVRSSSNDAIIGVILKKNNDKAPRNEGLFTIRKDKHIYTAATDTSDRSNDDDQKAIPDMALNAINDKVMELKDIKAKEDTVFEALSVKNDTVIKARNTKNDTVIEGRNAKTDIVMDAIDMGQNVKINAVKCTNDKEIRNVMEVAKTENGYKCNAIVTGTELKVIDNISGNRPGPNLARFEMVGFTNFRK